MFIGKLKAKSINFQKKKNKLTIKSMDFKKNKIIKFIPSNIFKIPMSINRSLTTKLFDLFLIYLFKNSKFLEKKKTYFFFEL